MSDTTITHVVTLPELTDVRQRAQLVRREAEALAVDSEASQAQAVTLLTKIASAQKDAEAKRAALVKPLNDHVKGINDLFRQVMAPVVEADRLLRQKLLAYRNDQARKAKEAADLAARQKAVADQIRLEAEAAKRRGDERQTAVLLNAAVDQYDAAKQIRAAAAPPPATAKTDVGAVTVRKRWTFEVVNLADVPRDYLRLDEQKVTAVIRAGVREIPGLRVFEVEEAAVRVGHGRGERGAE